VRGEDARPSGAEGPGMAAEAPERQNGPFLVLGPADASDALLRGRPRTAAYV
jgi:hypothetical protein